MLIVSPSYNRAGNVLSRKWFPDLVLAVNESQLSQYEDREGGSLIGVPDKYRGNMSKIRNHILEQVDPDEWVIQMDDDIHQFMRLIPGSKPKVLNSAEFLKFVDQNCMIADDLCTQLWGVNVQADPKFYREYTPFSLTSPVLATFCAMKPSSGIRYDARLFLNEDYDLFLQYLKKFRKVWRNNQYAYRAEHIDFAGGLKDVRSLHEERKQADLMIRKWGSKIVRYNLDRSPNPRLYTPIPGV